MRGSAMFTTVESSDAIAEPRIVAKRVQRPGADFIRSGTNASLTMAVPNLMSIASFEDAQSQPFGGQAGAEKKHVLQTAHFAQGCAEIPYSLIALARYRT